jgi:hypothetical protein
MKKKIVRLTEYDLRRIVKKVINEEQNLEMEVDKLIDDAEIMNALETEEETEEEIEIPEVILQLEKNPPRWYIRLKKRIERKRREINSRTSYKQKKKLKKINRILGGVAITTTVAIIALLTKFNDKFKNILNGFTGTVSGGNSSSGSGGEGLIGFGNRIPRQRP